jgi:hypothetical protein
MICAGTARTQRDRHLVAANARFTSIDALTGRIGHGYVAERWLQLLRKPQRHFVWRYRDFVAHAGLGTIEKGVSESFIHGE